jgi:hypothetical protein
MGAFSRESKDDASLHGDNNQNIANAEDESATAAIAEPTDAPPEGGYGWVVVFALGWMVRIDTYHMQLLPAN